MADADWSSISPRYVVVDELLGSGSYGRVQIAYDQIQRKDVAVKMIPNIFENLEDGKRILREISIMPKLRSDHLVQVYDVVMPTGAEGVDSIFIVMELCDTDLKHLLRMDVVLEPKQINTVLYHILLGLKYLHSAGVYHRDLKPANCLVNQDCTAKICDFGLSRTVRAIGHTADDADGGPRPRPLVRNLTGHVASRPYRAPELILLQDNYTDAIDVWSVGCIGAELVGMSEGMPQSDRGPLFLGATCFPLSPHRLHRTDGMFHIRSRSDQLNVIFDILGTPSERDMAHLTREDAKQYVRLFPARDGEGLQSKLPHAEAAPLNLLEQMLRFNPQDRITVNGAIEHEVLESIRDVSKEVTAAETIALPFEQEELSEETLRRRFTHQVERYAGMNLAASGVA